MNGIIYVDILFTVNIYIGYCLLILTGTLCKARINRLRILLSCVLQGLYSLVILLPVIPLAANLLLKGCACALFTFTAFRTYSKKQFFRLYFTFLCVSFAFAGIMLFACVVTQTDKISYKNTAVYLSVELKNLVFATVICYALSRVVYAIIRFRTPSASLYELNVFAFGKQLTVEALLDTGNSLTDCFSSLPVIVFNADKIKPIMPDGFDITDMTTLHTLPGFRIIPYGTVGGSSFMPAFRPEKVTIRSAAGIVDTENVIIGLCDTPLSGGNIGALLNAKMLEERSFDTNENKENRMQTI